MLNLPGLSQGNMPNPTPRANREDVACNISTSGITVVIILLGSLLNIGCGAPTSTPVAPVAPQISAVPFEQSIDVDLSSATAISPQAKFTISNQGNGPIV